MIAMRKNQNGFGIVEVLIIFVIVGVVGFGGWYVWQNKSEKGRDGNSQPVTTQDKPTAKTQEATEYGTINGKASYPSHGLPEDQAVCAVNVSDSTKVYCDSKVGARFAEQDVCKLGESACDKPAPDTSYSIKVPPGEYYVYSTAESKSPGYKAYYNEFSKCGLSVDCPAAGHKQYIKTIVTAGATINNIDPGDWYDR